MVLLELLGIGALATAAVLVASPTARQDVANIISSNTTLAAAQAQDLSGLTSNSGGSSVVMSLSEQLIAALAALKSSAGTSINITLPVGGSGNTPTTSPSNVITQVKMLNSQHVLSGGVIPFNSNPVINHAAAERNTSMVQQQSDLITAIEANPKAAASTFGKYQMKAGGNVAKLREMGLLPA